MPEPCATFEREMVLYHFGELPEAAHRRWDEHVATCGRCAEALRDLRATLTLVRERPRPEPPEAFWQDYKRSLRLRVGAVRPAPGWRRWLDGLIALRPLPSVATAGVLGAAVLASALLLRTPGERVPAEAMLTLEVLPVVQNLEVLQVLQVIEVADVLEDLDLLRALAEAMKVQAG